MAQLLWKRDDLTLQVGYNDNDQYNIISRFDITKIFPDFKAYDKVQKKVIVYGLKQKLSDKTARSKDQTLTNTEKAEIMEKTWDLLLTGEWSEKKTPATPLEKAENEVSKLTGMIDNAVKQAADLGITEKQAKDLAMKLFGDSLKAAQKKVKELSK